MLNPKQLYTYLEEKGTAFCTGVPDSLLKHFCAFLSEDKKDTIVANEGGAIALAVGHYLGTGNIPLVYLQNSGMGNCINPLVSIADREVYSIPMLLMIGWRGELGVADEPQHIKQGRISQQLLKTLEIPYCVLAKNFEEAKAQIDQAYTFMTKNSSAFALLVQKNTFKDILTSQKEHQRYSLTRENTLKTLLQHIGDDVAIVATTGKTSREVFELREGQGQSHNRDFLTVGGMGHASSIALGIAISQPNRKVVCIDGDGAFLMHMGAVGIIGSHAPKNLKHIVINNGCHDSVGGQPTIGFDVSLTTIAKAVGYKEVFDAATTKEIEATLPKLLNNQELSFLEIKIKKGSRENLGRPTIKPIENKGHFMAFLQSITVQD